MLKTFYLPSGHKKVSLGSNRQGTVHRFVAMAFLGPVPKGMCVAHKNAVKDDNRLENLQYTTFRGNNLHCRREGSDPCPLLRADRGRPVYMQKLRGRMAYGEGHGMASRTEQQAMRVHSLLQAGMSLKEVSEAMAVPYAWCANVAAGRRWRHLHPDLSLRK